MTAPASLSHPAGPLLQEGFSALVGAMTSRGFVARIVVHLEFRIEEPQRRAMGPELVAMTRRLLARGGWTELDAGGLYSRRTPFVGSVHIGHHRHLTDAHGLLRLHALPLARDLREVRAHLAGDLHHGLVIPRLELAPGGETPTASIVKVTRRFREERG